MYYWVHAACTSYSKLSTWRAMVTFAQGQSGIGKERLRNGGCREGTVYISQMVYRQN